MAQMVKDPLLRTSRVRPCTVVEAMQACLVRLHQISSNRYADTLVTFYKERNMYLAEDRILCFEIVTKKHEGWM